MIDTHKNRISHQLVDLRLKLKVLEIIEDMKSSTTDIKKLVDMSYEDALVYLSTKYKSDKESVSKVLQKSLSYLTKEHIDEIKELREQIDSLMNDDRDIYKLKVKKPGYLTINCNSDLQSMNMQLVSEVAGVCYNHYGLPVGVSKYKYFVPKGTYYLSFLKDSLFMFI